MLFQISFKSILNAFQVKLNLSVKIIEKKIWVHKDYEDVFCFQILLKIK